MTDYQLEKTLADHRAWLGMLSPEGLVVSPAVLADAQVILGTADPERQRLFASGGSWVIPWRGSNSPQQVRLPALNFRASLHGPGFTN